MKDKYSSKAQAENGIDNTTIMTPLRVKQSILVNSPAAPQATQSDWNEADPTAPAYIKNKPVIPNKTSQLTNDSNFISDASYVHTDNNYTTTEKTKLSGIEDGAEVNVQSDWSQSDNTKDDYIKNKPTIPTVNDATLTIQKNGTTVQTFSANQSGNATANITVPTKVSDLTNDSGFITTETDPVFGDSVAYTIDDDDIDYWNDKQQLLVSGQNIKTINNMSILGAGNLLIGEGGIVATDVSINGTSITSDGSANIVTDGAYDPNTNKIATQSTVEAAIGDLIDYVYYQEESFTNPITGTTATEGVVSVGKVDNPVQLKLGRNVVKVRLNNSDVVYIGTDTGGKTRIYANNMNALQSIKLGDFSWTKLSDGSIVFGGDE